MKQILKAEQEVKIKHFNFLLVIFFYMRISNTFLGSGGGSKKQKQSQHFAKSVGALCDITVGSFF